MSLYHVETVSLPYPPYRVCSTHDECKDCVKAGQPEMARLCGMTANVPGRYEHKVEGDIVAMHRVATKVTDYDGAVDEDGRRPTVVKHYEFRVHETYKGRVVSFGTDYNVRVMSDVYDDVPYAIVIEDDGSYKKVSRYSGPGFDPLCYQKPSISDTVDVTPEWAAKHEAWLKAEEARKQAEWEAAAPAREAAAKKAAAEAAKKAAKDAKKPAKGKVVKVVKVSKFTGEAKVGMTGKCFWLGESKNGYNTLRAGIETPDGKKYFLPASYLEAA